MNRNPITLEALEVLDAIERRGSFAKAAEELGKATSALSYLIQKLEEQLAVTLFQRQGRRSVLTPAGRVLLEEGRHIINATHLLAERTRETATGWEPSLRIAVESVVDQDLLFEQLSGFLEQHPSIEVDISECVLNGGWDALEHERVDLVVGAPGPVPKQKGFRTVELAQTDMIPVIGQSHPLSKLADDPDQLIKALPQIRRVISHDTTAVHSATNIARTVGLAEGQMRLYVQTSAQKISAIVAGLGIGHLPRKHIQPLLRDKTLLPLELGNQTPGINYLAWRLSHKGKGLKELIRRLTEQDWDRDMA